MAITEISVSKIYVLATEPTNKVKDRFWFDTTNNLLKRYDGTSWKPISVSSDDVVILSNGNKVSLTNYLNTQIAALVEGIDSKQDKLTYYSEVSGDTPSATISVANIKLKGSVAEGSNTTASGFGSHAEGSNTTASGDNSHAEGGSTTALSRYQHAQGKYNIEDTNNTYADIIGNGSPSARSNAATVSWDGISWSQTDVRAGGTDQDNATYSLIALAEGIDSKQDKLKFYTEVDKSDDTSSTAEASKLTFKTSASQYGGSEINLIASNGEYKSGNINLKAKSWNTSNGGYITLESEGGSASGGNITLHSKVNTGGSAEPGGRIEIIADGSSAQATNNPGAGIITLNAKDGSASNDNESITFEGTINLNATKVQKNGVDIATATDLATKQNTLQFYIESGSTTTTTAKITAYNFEVASAQIKLDSEYGIDGNILEKTISETSSDTKIPTAKAVYTAIDAIKPTYYSEDTSSSDEYAKISINKTSINVSESGGIILTAGNSADLGNIKLGLNTSSFILDSTGSLKGDTINLLTIQSNVKNGSISSLSGDLISKSITSSSTDTQLPTAKSVYTAVNAKANKSTTLSGYGITNAYTKTEVDTELGKKQDALNCYRETASGEAIISNATSFSVNDTTNGLIVENSNGGITIQGNVFKAGQGAISLSGNVWNGGAEILFDYDGQGVSLSDALLIPEIKDKQNSSDSDLTTNNKTIVGAINELNSQVNTTIPEPITSVYTISSTALSSIISNTTYAGISGQILISADVENTGPILIGESITDKANAFPIYPDQIFPIPFSDINNFKVTGNIGNKFNYIISFRSLNNTSPAVNGGITILNENGYYKLTPEGDGDTATLVITKLK